jgi:alginate O-acetyltransferase complex protein AlgI
MLVGPINRAQPFFDDLRGHTWSSEHVSRGIERILYGYAKITILSGLLVNRLLDGYIASLPEEAGAQQAYLTIVRNGLDLYFLFAGYSDIAIGFGRLLGFRIMENFRWPYLQKNISDFWRCWHISLSSWCRDYIYLPVVGLTRSPYLATLATFTAIGLWHELSYRYILWGLWHGVGIVLWRRFQELKRAARLPKVKHPVGRLAVDAASIALTLHYVFLGLVIVTEESLAEAGRVYYTVLFGW